MRRVRANIVVGNTKRITYSECVLSFMCQARNAHVPCCQLWSVRLHITFPHYRKMVMIFEEINTQHEMRVSFIQNFV